MTSSDFQPDTPGTDTDSPSDASPAVEPAEWVSHALSTLTARQKLVVELYWGLRDGTEYSLREIAKAIRVDYSTVWECYHSALTKMEKLEAPINPPLEGGEERNHGRKAKQLTETDRSRWTWLS